MAVQQASLRLKVGDLAALAGVSPQTIRLWEKQGLLQSSRTSGGQRLFTEADGERATRIAGLRRRHGWNPAAIRSALADTATGPPPADQPEQVYGPRIRAARKALGLTLEQAAMGAGISRSTLSAIELGSASVTPQLLSSIADALGTSMSAFVPRASSQGRVMRADDRPVTTMAGGVRWEELARAGAGVEPALLVIPPGGSSGGDYTRPGEVWVCVLHGRLSFRITGADDAVLDLGDAILLERNATWNWRNDGDVETRAIYVETSA